MDKIDLTLRGEFRKDSNRQFDDTRRYKQNIGHEDQRRSKLHILDIDAMVMFFGRDMIIHQYEDFFTEYKHNHLDLRIHEDIRRITGLLTNWLKEEYDSGYGNDNVCDCCGHFRSSILNSRRFGLCNKCERFHQMDNRHFWERTFRLEENWID